MNAHFLEAARDELKVAIAYYDNQRAGLGDAFAEEAENAVQRIVALPQAWSLLGRNVRRCRLNRFPYGLVYTVVGNEIRIVAVMHLHRQPGYWKERLDS